MSFMEAAKSNIEFYSYHLPDGALKGQTYYVLKSGKVNSFAYSPNMRIRYIEMKNTNNILEGKFEYLKTIPINQLKIMLVLKPDLRIEDLLNELHAD